MANLSDLTSLSDLENAALTEIVAGHGWLPNQPGPAWTQRWVLEVAFGRETIVGLIAAGWVADWPELKSVTLTPWAADQLGVRIEERPGDEVEVWVPVTEPERPYRLPRHQGVMPCLDQLPDSLPVKIDDEIAEDREDQGPRIAQDTRPRLAGGLGRLTVEASKRRKPGRFLAG